jgi:D-alanine-D-alanine ligase-like ATP-grasp enzyme
VTLRLSGDKPTIHKLLKSAGLPTPEYATFDRRDLSAPTRLMAEQHGPWVVKPAFGTGRGRGVTCGVSTHADLRRAAVWASRWSSSLLIERQGTGEEYRVLVLDGEVLDAIRRRPPHVTGDGRRSVAELIEAENARRAQSNGTVGLFPISVNLDCLLALRDAGMSLDSVPADGVELAVKKTANENGSRDNESVLDAVGPSLRSAMRTAAATIGARLASFEVVGHGLDNALSSGMIVEVNTTPGLHYHYHVANPARAAPVAVPILRTLLEAPGRRSDPPHAARPPAGDRPQP